LILSNKIDLNPHLSEIDIIKELNLDYVYSNPWIVIPISGLIGTNLEQVIEWLSKKGK
jgi:Arf/Sar family protein